MTETSNTSKSNDVEGVEEVRAIPGFNRFVAIDIETTGLDPKEGEIIELGAVLFIDGAEADTFHMMVKPEHGYPERNRRLTGIEPELLDSGTPIKDALVDLVEFIGDDLLVSHNAQFDSGFINHYSTACGRDEISNPTLCTLHFSAFLNPEAPTLQLSTLARSWGVEIIDPHRALQDARMAGRMYLRMVEELKSWSPAFIAHLASYRGKSLDPIFDLLDTILGEGQFDPDWMLSDAVRAQLDAPEAVSDLPPFKVPIEPEKTEPLFDDVLASETVQAFDRKGVTLIDDFRPGKFPMSCSVSPGSEGIPKFVVAVPDDAHIQMLIDDSDHSDGAGTESDVFYCGRRSEYVCMFQAFEKDGRPRGWLELSPYERIVFARWLAGTRTGRVARVNWWLLNNYSGLKGHLNGLSVAGYECVGRNGHRVTPCYAESAKEYARKATRVIVHQRHLCEEILNIPYADRLIEKADAVIVEGAARLTHAARASGSRIVELDSLRRQFGLIGEIVQDDDPELHEILESAAGVAKDMFVACADTIRDYRESRPRESAGIIPIDEDVYSQDNFTELAAALDVARDRLIEICKTLDALEMKTPERKLVSISLNKFKVTITLFREDGIDWAVSIEGTPARNPKRIVLRISPVDVGGIIKRVCDEAEQGFIGCDRLLRYQGTFERLKSHWGLLQESSVHEIVLSDPAQQAPPLFLPVDVTAPAARSGRRYHWEKYMERTANLLRMTSEALGGRTVAVFSAHHELRKVRELLHENPPNGAIVLAQYMDGTKSALVREYLNNPATLLLGGRNFLEGVDLGSVGFTALVLVKLPFVSPEEPLHKASLKYYESAGNDGMRSYLVPLAVETANKWIDSLLAGPMSSDAGTGAVIVLDPRAVQHEWGDEFVDSLNAGPAVRLSFREMLSQLKEMV